MGSIISLSVQDAALGTATVIIDEPLAGGETFTACRVANFAAGPGFGNQTIPLTASGPTTVTQGEQYTLTWPTILNNLAQQDLWWVTTEISGDQTRTPAFIWLVSSLEDHYTSGGEMLASILNANAGPISALLQAVDPNLNFRSAAFGSEWNRSRQTPGVLIKPRAVNENYETMPRGLLVIMEYDVSAVIRASDAQNEAKAISQFRMALTRILNQSCYETVEFPNGDTANGGWSGVWSFGDDLIESDWCSRVDTTWKWELIRYTG